MHEMHGHTPNDPKRWHPLYRTWLTMKSRCNNPRFPKYSRYGGRGIRVCDQWLHSFATFLKDVGPKPSPKHSLDRKDNDGDYEPGNVRWATPLEQCANKSSNTNITYDGLTLCASEWARRTGIGISTISYRRRRGWPPGKILGME